MEELFKNLQLSGNYKEVFEEFKSTKDLTEKEADTLEAIVGLVQLIVNVEKLPLQMENELLHVKLTEAKKEARKYKIKCEALEEANKELNIDAEKLVRSLTAMKELSIADDRIEAVSLDK